MTEINDELLIDISENYFIRLHSDCTELLFKSGLLELSDFVEIVNDFPEFSFELKYPSENFDEIYECVLKIKNAEGKKTNIQISVFVIGIFNVDLSSILEKK